MKNSLLYFKAGSLLLGLCISSQIFAGNNSTPKSKTKWKLVWSDEFNKPGKPDSRNWNFEHGFARNEEYQWYQADNAFCENGLLIIEGRKEEIKNPNYIPGSNNWKTNREFAHYSAASMVSEGLREFQYGRFEIRARIDTSMGLWPAIWTLGIKGEWPSNGEIDLMESYPINGEHCILANVASGTTRRYNAKWHSQKTLLKHFLEKDPQWPSKFHIWRMDWDENTIKLYLDNELLNETKQSDTVNPDGSYPFRQPQYILLNLAIGGQNGGDPSKTKFPNRYEVDYVRVYQKK
ncbi:family 16 glycosylhydrolase [Parabacteroides sp. FAFU027]|uniref:glycoside hydrolase family 16 protein n=1 Tax=Parabacteroides sp. FAFU027 TaxID=2922715 RepID=UPI001FAF133A|nr:glycoside hydrolase family 16 protein [Parabacteroides sp. FAFU027]